MLRFKNSRVVFESDKCMQCGVCLSSCHQQALSFRRNEKIFEIKVDSDKCVKCKRCIKVCPSNFVFKDDCSPSADFVNAYITASKDKTTKYERSSGGTIFEIVDAFLKRGGYVYTLGKYDNIHRIYSSGLLRCIGDMPNSIYAPTLWGKNLKEIRTLANGSKLLLVGLPCQLKSAMRLLEGTLKRKDIKLYRICIVCRKTKDLRFTKYIRKYFDAPSEQDIFYRGKGWPGKVGTVGTASKSLFFPP